MVAATLKNSLAVSHKIKHALTIQLNNCTLGHFKHVFVPKQLYANICNSVAITYSSKKIENNPKSPSAGYWLVKPTLAHPSHGLLFSNKEG